MDGTSIVPPAHTIVVVAKQSDEVIIDSENSQEAKTCFDWLYNIRQSSSSGIGNRESGIGYEHHGSAASVYQVNLYARNE